jgi:hypothetical protein
MCSAILNRLSVFEIIRLSSGTLEKLARYEDIGDSSWELNSKVHDVLASLPMMRLSSYKLHS